ncbi:hypothetical protein DKX38_009928 [Salix brachista]|uniref:Uncharacterized protein n=1 Tax=Salix brachista TaxID=2182728 RepID=A0A5N5MC27_9ROSI|nr:hypothetical protein DKX38_009928 [Salix brachista]
MDRMHNTSGEIRTASFATVRQKPMTIFFFNTGTPSKYGRRSWEGLVHAGHPSHGQAFLNGLQPDITDRNSRVFHNHAKLVQTLSEEVSTNQRSAH